MEVYDNNDEYSYVEQAVQMHLSGLDMNSKEIQNGHHQNGYQTINQNQSNSYMNHYQNGDSRENGQSHLNGEPDFNEQSYQQVEHYKNGYSYQNGQQYFQQYGSVDDKQQLIQQDEIQQVVKRENKQQRLFSSDLQDNEPQNKKKRVLDLDNMMLDVVNFKRIEASQEKKLSKRLVFIITISSPTTQYEKTIQITYDQFSKTMIGLVNYGYKLLSLSNYECLELEDSQNDSQVQEYVRTMRAILQKVYLHNNFIFIIFYNQEIQTRKDLLSLESIQEMIYMNEDKNTVEDEFLDLLPAKLIHKQDIIEEELEISSSHQDTLNNIIYVTQQVILLKIYYFNINSQIYILKIIDLKIFILLQTKLKREITNNLFFFEIYIDIQLQYQKNLTPLSRLGRIWSFIDSQILGSILAFRVSKEEGCMVPKYTLVSKKYFDFRLLSLEFSKEKNLLLLGSHHGYLYHQTIGPNEPINKKSNSVQAGNEEIIKITLFPSNQYALLLMPTGIKIFDLNTLQIVAGGSLKKRLEGAELTCSQIDQNNQIIYIGTNKGCIMSYEFNNLKLDYCSTHFLDENLPVSSIINHKEYLFVSQGGQSNVFKIKKQKPELQLQLNGQFDLGKYMNQKQNNMKLRCPIYIQKYSLFVSGSDTGMIIFWSVKDGNVLSVIQVTQDSKPIVCIQYVECENYLLVTLQEGTKILKMGKIEDSLMNEVKKSLNYID